MVEKVDNPKVLLAKGAYDFAFHAGQCLEGLLLDRALERAASDGKALATTSHVRNALDDALIQELLTEIRADGFGTRRHQRRVSA